MKLMSFAVFDKAVGAFLPPLFFRSKGEAIRAFMEAVNNPEQPFGKHALDYTFMSIGAWDDATGIFESVDPVRVLGASECVSSDTVVMGDPAPSFAPVSLAESLRRA
jgi:hypothetical protein